MAGSSPAAAPMSRVAAADPGFGRDDDGLAMGAGVDHGGDRADGDANDTAGQGQQDGLGQELDPDLASFTARLSPAAADKDLVDAAGSHRVRDLVFSGQPFEELPQGTELGRV